MACKSLLRWKWMVVFGSFMVNFIMEGSFNAFGVIYTDLLIYFKDTKSRVAWIGSLYFALPLIGGPVASLIATKFGCRFAAILGGLFAVLGILASSFVTSVELMYVTFGCISGLAYSLPYVASVLILSQYFDTRLGLVNGIVECGAALGTIVLPIVFEELSSMYGWRGVLMILGGLVLNIVVCGALYRQTSKNSTASEETNDSKSSVTDAKESTDTKKLPFVESIDKPTIGTYLRPSTDVTEMLPTLDLGSQPPVSLSMATYDLQRGSKSNCTSTLENMERDAEKVCRLDTQNMPSTDVTNQDLPQSGNLKSQDIPTATCKSPLENVDRNPEKESGLEKEGILVSITEDLDDIPSETKEKTKESWCRTCVSSLRLGVFANAQFVAYLAIMVVLYMWIDVPYVYLSDRAIGFGIDKRMAALLLSCMGILQLVGNILFGYVGDNKRIDNVITFGISVVLSGVALALVPLFTAFGPLAALAGCFGFFTAAAEAMCSVMLVEFLSVGKLGVGYGYAMLLKGTAELIGPPIAGWLFDISGSYDNTFYVSGGTLAVSALIYTAVAKVMSRIQKRKINDVKSNE